ncbi:MULTISPECIES: ThuA domain-containing protein [unclassified Mucilaginibacter]|uniref:ThuA domain-containing protein n=1 Tax=unclassified Mucilaginibacter TaxID=2617802 RepID=UPI002AC9CA73|nr:MULTISPECIES: ThuA domain-containing protein [unclassified Mucilaginibacter]MEB0261231.1 ThuA domain-containing protein [Mucilaginibacter sp. 10I4]MEB0279055.1 ThuA domain-containing protein [Mucilaginibacter sp. 10B2]MEB0299926.1 ThuA domain-containing protein [Mucilaginibacter sp. 5C4]WPX22233.1 ThuA domain-containing protein [Mucilaginibacter sp. 5C4]
MKIKNILTTLLLTCLIISVSFAKAKPKVLVFCKTAGFHHESIAVGIPAIIKLGKENNFDVDTTTNSVKFTTANLKQYAAVIFLSTTGDVLNNEQQTAFEQYIKSGKGFVGIHAATDTEYDWPWYGNLVGAYFKSHPAKQQEANLDVVDRDFPATNHLPATWRRLDEWYNFKWIAPDLHVLIKIDEKSYTGGENGDNHPMSWYHNYDGGRAFYTALGHTDASYADPLYLKHLLGGIQYAIGKK